MWDDTTAPPEKIISLSFYGQLRPYRIICFIKFCHTCKGSTSLHDADWRREWDLNPRGLWPQLFSRQCRYDRFGISAYSRSDRTRTCDLSIPNAARYHLRYTPIYWHLTRKIHSTVLLCYKRQYLTNIAERTHLRCSARLIKDLSFVLTLHDQ